MAWRHCNTAQSGLCACRSAVGRRGTNGCDGLCRQTSAVSAPAAALSRRLRLERCMAMRHVSGCVAHATCQAAWRMPCGIGARYPPLRPTARETRAHGARAHPAAPAGENTPNHWRVQCRAAVAIRSRRARRVRSGHRIECAPCTMQHTIRQHAANTAQPTYDARPVRLQLRIRLRGCPLHDGCCKRPTSAASPSR